MKKFTMFVFGFLLVCNAGAQIRVQPVENVQTGFLYNLSHQFSGMERFAGDENTEAIRHSAWNQVYFELSQSAVQEWEFAPVTSIHRQAKTLIRENKIPLGLIFFNYNFLDENTEILPDADGVLDISQTELNERIVFAPTAFRSETFNGSKLVFELPESFLFSNQMNASVHLSIDFDDGTGWQQISPDREMTVSYTSTGQKEITLKARLNSGDELTGKFILNVKKLVTPEPDAVWIVESNLSYNDITTSGDAFILYGEGNATLTSPIIISEGVDFDDTYTWETLYELFNQQNLLEDLRTEGFDIVVLNFHEPLTYIQSNAYLFVKLVEMVNDTINFGTQIPVVGPSMGGLVTRYALNYMELNNIEHNCNLWVSFDAPHQGANMPLGLQYELYFFRELDANIQLLLDVLDQPAPRQMLAYHYTDPPSSPAGNDILFDELQTELADLGGFPENMRIIALSNGRGDGVGQPYNAGDQVIEYEYNSFLVNIKGNAWAVENNATGQVFEGLIDPLFGATDQLNVNVFSDKPWDNAPGGARSTFADIDTLEAPYGDIIALQDSHAYIPTVSAFALSTNDLFYNLAADPQIMLLTPFDSIYWSSENYDHTYISPYTAQIAITEILSAQPETHDILLTAGWNNISSYIDPSDKNIENLTAQLGDDLVILQHFGEVYWPQGGVNTITNWDYSKGYLLKVTSENTLTVSGNPPADNNIQINQGWNLIPVLCKECGSIISLLGSDLEKVKVIKEAAGLGIFWPEAGVYTLNQLMPGKSYYLFANESFFLDFP
jgi:hypothetical protein